MGNWTSLLTCFNVVRLRHLFLLIFVPAALMVGVCNIYIIFNLEKPSLHTNDASYYEKKCALLFFGLVKDYRELILPSIRRNILELNPRCDIFLHTYNITNVPMNARSAETMGSPIRVDDAYLLTDNIVTDTITEFWDKRGKIVNYTQKHHHEPWGPCPPCTSHNNMIMQWHSIKAVWDLMVQHEQKILFGREHEYQNHHANSENHYYEQIGFFRSDVYYPSPISIFEHSAGLPRFASNAGYNDRLFYGERRYASIWADRFSFVEEFIQKHMHRWIGHKGFHSETFVGALLKSNRVPVHENSNICVWRVRSGMRVSINDCDDSRDDFNVKRMSKAVLLRHIPIGYGVREEDGDLFQVIPPVTLNTNMNQTLRWSKQSTRLESRRRQLKLLLRIT